jgi:hypothetical protein
VTFEEYLISKKIDSAAFKAAEPVRWQEWEQLFSTMSAESFTSQKLYLINPIRRKHQLKDAPPQTQTNTPQATPPVTERTTGEVKPKVAKPVFKPKIS